ncbi:MAG TPA: glycosyltransferase [Jatrophihabitans sp.]|nr:glycosyltransferase [Jatrophihabitans sp.]
MDEQGLTALGVAIPVHNEEQLLPHCLNAIARAAAPLPVRVVVALDRCRDGSADVVAAAAATGLDVRAVRPDRPGVGAARAAAITALLTDLDPQCTWLASTDADSVVPADWFVRQLAHAARGAEMVVGTVRVDDWSEHPPEVRQRYLAGYRARAGHRHMHGANLSFSASAYLSAGGFRARLFDEDVDLIGRFQHDGLPMVWAADVEVITSARRTGRAPNGFAQFLTGLQPDLEEVT